MTASKKRTIKIKMLHKGFPKELSFFYGEFFFWNQTIRIKNYPKNLKFLLLGLFPEKGKIKSSKG